MEPFNYEVALNKERTYQHYHVRGISKIIGNSAEEQIFPVTGVLPFPAAAATTTVVSTETTDTNDSGDGARTVSIVGLDANYNIIRDEDVELDGDTPVTLSNDYLRVIGMEVQTAGTNGSNDGLLEVKHASTIIHAMPVGHNKSRPGCFTVPDGYVAIIPGLYFSAGKNETHTLRFWVSNPETGLFSEDYEEIITARSGQVVFNIPHDYPEHTDMYFTSILESGTNGVIAVNMDIALKLATTHEEDLFHL